jgi:hypothetical protein
MFLIKVNILFSQCKHFSQVEPFEKLWFLNTCSEKNVNINIISLILVKDQVLQASLGSKYTTNMNFNELSIGMIGSL